MARKVVGLDIGTTAVRAAEVSVRRGKAVLERIGQAGLPEGAVVDGEVIDPAAVAAAIKDLWRRTRISSRQVLIGVANQRVVVRLVDYAVISELEGVPGASGCCGCCWSPPRRRCSPATGRSTCRPARRPQRSCSPAGWSCPTRGGRED